LISMSDQWEEQRQLRKELRSHLMAAVERAELAKALSGESPDLFE